LPKGAFGEYRGKKNPKKILEGPFLAGRKKGDLLKNRLPS
jgi:hypothetical protein